MKRDAITPRRTPHRALVAIATAMLLLLACARKLDGRWTVPAVGSPRPVRLAGSDCSVPTGRRDPPPDAPALTDSEAIAFIPQMIDGDLCVSAARSASRCVVDVLVNSSADHITLVASVAPDSLLRALSLPSGAPLPASQLHDRIVVRDAEAGLSWLTLKRAAGSGEFDVTASAIVAGAHSAAAGTVRLSRRDADRLIDVLRRAAVLARAEDARGVEETLP